MYDGDINKMNFRQLRDEVQLLRDELAVFKRKYEDTVYNLDSDNFGKSFTVEQNNMKAQIKIAADAVKSMVSDTDLQLELEKYSTIEQTAEKIELAVVRIDNSTDEKLKEYSTLTQTAEAITGTVTKDFVSTLIGDAYVTDAKLTSKISQSADEIYLSVSRKYETIENAETIYEELDDYISDVSLNADKLSTRVTSLESFKTSVFTQTADGFTLDGNQTTFTGVIFLTDNDGNKKFAFFDDESQGYEQIIIGSTGASAGLPITIGNSKDELHFENVKSITWGNNAPVAVFG